MVAVGEFLDLGDIEIDNFYFPFDRVVEDVVRLDVSMANTNSMHIVDRF